MNWVRRWNRKDLAEYILIIGITLFFDKELICAVLSLFVLGKTRNLLLINVKFFLCFSVLFVYGSIVTMLNCYDQAKMFQQALLFCLFYQVYYSVFESFKNDLPSLFSKYLNVCVFMSLYAVVYFLLTFRRANAWQIEPACFSAIITPATAYYVLFDSLKNRRALIVLLANVLSLSTAAVAIICLMFFFRYAFHRNIIYKFIFILFSFLVTSSTVFIQQLKEGMFADIYMKMDESLSAYSNFNMSYFETLNLSTFAWFSNLYVAFNAPDRLFGTGLGTHEHSYDLIYPISDYIAWGLNKSDAYSLFIRFFSEFGVIGVVFLLMFLVRRFNAKNTINVSILFFLLYSLLRGGNYILYGRVFFFFFFYYTSKRQFSEKL